MSATLESTQGDAERQRWREQMGKLGADAANLQRATAAHRFAIGDLLTQGEEKQWRHVYEDAARLLNNNYTVKELYGFAWVARKVKTYLRKEVLCWSHFMAVAPLEESLQEQYLAEAAETGMSVSSLRRRIAISAPDEPSNNDNKPATPKLTLELPSEMAAMLDKLSLDLGNSPRGVALRGLWWALTQCELAEKIKTTEEYREKFEPNNTLKAMIERSQPIDKRLAQDLAKAAAAIATLVATAEGRTRLRVCNEPTPSPEAIGALRSAIESESQRMQRALTDHRLLWSIYRSEDRSAAPYWRASGTQDQPAAEPQNTADVAEVELAAAYAGAEARRNPILKANEEKTMSDRNLDFLDSELPDDFEEELDENGLTAQERLALEDDRAVEDEQEEHQFDDEEEF